MTYAHAFLSLLLVALLIALLRGVGSRRARRAARIAGVSLLLWSWRPIACLTSMTLERWYPVRPIPAEAAEAIVVLAEGVRIRDESMQDDQPTSETYQRCSHAAWLFQNWRRVPILVTGGPARSGSRVAVLAQVMARVLAEQGVPASMIWIEGRSHSTYENALYSAEVLRQKGIRRVVLVTAAQHMLRSMACFRRQGLIPIPAAVGYRSLHFHAQWTEFLPNAGAISENEDNLHEWAGLAWYKLSGKI